MTPEGWRRVHLSEVADRRTEKAVPAETDTRPYVALEHLAQGNPALLGWSEASAAGSAKTVFRKGDVLFGKLRPYLRKAAPAPFDGLCSTDILALFSRNALDMRYLTQIAQWHPLQQHAVATSSGTKMPRTSWPQLGVFSFALPPHREQRKIAAILSSVDDAIEKTQAVIDQVQVVKRGLMQDLLTRGLPGRHTRFKQTEVGEIPEEWSLSLLSDVVFFLEGPGLRKWLFRDRGMPFINIRCIRNDGTLDLSSVQYIAEDKAQNSYRHFFLEANDTVLSSSGTLGRMAVVREADLPLMLNTSVIRFRTLNDDVCATSYMRAFLSSEIFLNQVLRESQGSAQANFGPTHLRKVKIPLPPVAEQKVLSAAFTAPSERLMAERTKKKCLAKLKSALMSVLLTGELRVTPDPEIA